MLRGDILIGGILATALIDTGAEVLRNHIIQIIFLVVPKL